MIEWKFDSHDTSFSTRANFGRDGLNAPRSTLAVAAVYDRRKFSVGRAIDPNRLVVKGRYGAHPSHRR
jgi:hypothetical protein